MRFLTYGFVFLFAACSGDAPDDEIEEASTTGTFFGAFFDELRGQPSASALKELKHFNQAGISFDYPAVLRARVETDSYTNWEFTRGDVELELHVPDFDYSANAYLGALADTMSSDKRPSVGPKDAATVQWCGISITGVLWRINFFGDWHELHGFDLPATDKGSRFLVISDIVESGPWSATAQATFDVLNGSIRCDESK
jgi:hypothetical protein